MQCCASEVQLQNELAALHSEMQARESQTATQVPPLLAVLILVVALPECAPCQIASVQQCCASLQVPSPCLLHTACLLLSLTGDSSPFKHPQAGPWARVSPTLRINTTHR